MTVRRQERKVEDELLKRELLLRLRSEYYATPVRTRAATDDFRRRVRRLLFRHPLFAFKYYRLSVDRGLGRIEGTIKSTSRPPAGASIASAPAGEGAIMSRMAYMHADDPRAPFLFDFDATYTAEGWSSRIAWRAFAYETEPDADTEWSGIENPTGRVLAHMVGDDREYAFEPDDLAPRKRARLVAEGRRQRLILFACVVRFGLRARTLAYPRLVQGLRVCESVSAAGVVALRRQGLFWFARLVRVCRSFAAALAALRRALALLCARLVRALRTFGSGVAGLVAEGRRQWPVLRVGLVAVTRECESALTGLVAAGRRQRLLIYRGLVHLQRACESRRDRLLTELRQQRVLMHARLVHLRRDCGSRLVRFLTELRRQRLVLRAHLVRALRTFGSEVAGLVAEGRRQWPVLRVGLVHVTRECGSALMGLVLAGRRQRLLMYARLVRLRRAGAARLARFLTELRRQRLVLYARLIHVRLTTGSGLIGLVAASRRQWRWWRERLFRVERAWRSAVAGHVAAGRRLVLQERVARLGPHPRGAVARALVAARRKSKLRLRGFHRSRTASTATRAPVRRRFPRAAGGILAGVALAAVAATAVVATRHLESNGESSATGSGKPQSADQIVHGFLHFPAVSTPTAEAHTNPRAPKHVGRPTARTARHVRPKVAQRMTLVSNTVQAASIPTAPTTSTTAAAVPHSTGASPLPAPPGASGPSPLKAP
jgi:hypothetical protein